MEDNCFTNALYRVCCAIKLLFTILRLYLRNWYFTSKIYFTIITHNSVWRYWDTICQIQSRLFPSNNIKYLNWKVIVFIIVLQTGFLYKYNHIISNTWWRKKKDPPTVFIEIAIPGKRSSEKPMYFVILVKLRHFSSIVQ